MRPDAARCAYCGRQRTERRLAQRHALHSLLAYYLPSILMVALYQHSGFFRQNHTSLIVFDLMLSFFTLAFAYAQRSVLLPLLSLRGLHWARLAFLALFAVGIGIGVSLLADALNETLYHQKHHVSFIFWDTPYPKTLAIAFICLQPALIEEIGYRGLILEYLRALFPRPWQAIAGSACLFSLLHFALISWLWLFPLGVLLAYYRLRKGSLWYGIVAHFCYNFAIVWMEW